MPQNEPPIAPLQGKITTKPRPFHEVVEDFRHIVFTVIRLRPEDGGFLAKPLGSGFFIGPKLFFTCHHVINGSQDPHKDGDTYQFVNNHGRGGLIIEMKQGVVGQQMHFFPDRDSALLHIDVPNAYAALDFRDPYPGREIGVAGYPLPILMKGKNDSLRYDGLIYRVAKSVITACTTGVINPDSGPQTLPIQRIEVNFLFVPGNSGGPVFDSQTGRVLGFVHGYQAHRIRERIVKTDLQDIPGGMGKEYYENIHAIYSMAISITCLREELEKKGIHA